VSPGSGLPARATSQGKALSLLFFPKAVRKNSILAGLCPTEKPEYSLSNTPFTLLRKQEQIRYRLLLFL